MAWIYLTAWTTRDQIVQFRNDIYDQDKQLLEATAEEAAFFGQAANDPLAAHLAQSAAQSLLSRERHSPLSRRRSMAWAYRKSDDRSSRPYQLQLQPIGVSIGAFDTFKRDNMHSSQRVH